MRYERQAIADMQGYSYGEQPETAGVIKLNTNENPYPPSPGVAEALNGFDVNILRRYPEATSRKFRIAAADLHGLTGEQIIATNGGDELLRLAVTTFVPSGGVMGGVVPGYSLYPVLAAVQNAHFLTSSLQADYLLSENIADEMNAKGAKLLLLVNPHAPSGSLTDVSVLDQIAERFDGVLLLDEAYVDFVDPGTEYNALKLLAKHENVLILRTLSKGYSLAGLRFAYGMGAPKLIQPMMDKTKDSYNLDALAQCLAERALSDQLYAQEIWSKVRAERTRLREALQNLGWHSPASEANFILARCPKTDDATAQSYFKALRERNILVRYFEAPDLADMLRITLGRPEENDALLSALADITTGM